MRAAAVLRVSSAGQADPARDSIPGQRRLAEEWCQAEGWTLARVYDETAEKGYQSGRDRMNDRPYIQEMLRDARAGLFDVVIFREPSRLGRDDVEALVLGRDLREVGVLVGFSGDRRVADIEKTQDRLLFYLGQWQADMDWGYLTGRMREGKLGRARLGYWPSGVAPYGYALTSDKRLELAPSEAVAIVDGFRLLASGETLQETARLLSLRHVYRARRAVAADGFTSGGVASWLRNEAYVTGSWPRTFQTPEGELVVHVPAPPILDRELWESAHAIYSRTRGRYWTGRRVKSSWRSYPLTGYLYHRDDAGGLDAMVGQTKNGGRSVYKCKAAETAHPGECSGFGVWRTRQRTSLNAPRLEAEVALALACRLSSPEALEDWEAERRESALRRADVQGDRSVIDEKLHGLGEERDRIRRLFVRGLLDEGGMDEMLRDVERREAELRDALAAIDAAETAGGLGDGLGAALLAMTVGYGSDVDALAEEAVAVLEGRRVEMTAYGREWLEAALEAMGGRVIVERGSEDPVGYTVTAEVGSGPDWRNGYGARLFEVGT